MDSENLKEALRQYVLSLNEKERKALEIAKDQLGETYSMKKSNGFLDWLKKNPQHHLK
jgi:hypothetical protein